MSTVHNVITNSTLYRYLLRKGANTYHKMDCITSNTVIVDILCKAKKQYLIKYTNDSIIPTGNVVALIEKTYKRYKIDTRYVMIFKRN